MNKLITNRIMLLEAKLEQLTEERLYLSNTIARLREKEEACDETMIKIQARLEELKELLHNMTKKEEKQ